MIGLVFIFSIFVISFGLIAALTSIWLRVRVLYLIYGGLASVVFMFYLAIDVQMIMGGRELEIEPEEYIFAAIQIFLDIIYIFWILLAMFGGGGGG